MRLVALTLVLVVVSALTAVDAVGATRAMGMYPTSSPSALPLAMVDSAVDISIRGPIVEAVVTQRFRNPTSNAIEATYVFPLPHDAAVSAMSIRIGSRTIHASIETRAEAQRRYEEAIRAGVEGAVLDQERPDVFTQTVAAIPANATIDVVLRYDAVARYLDGRWSLVLPMVVAPRFVPGTASGLPTSGTGRAPDTDRAPDASRITPNGAPEAGGATSVSLVFEDPVTSVTCPTHELAGSGSRFRFVDPRSDHDAVIQWASTTSSIAWVEPGPARSGFAAVLVQAPRAAARTARATQLTLVLDHAATMKGDAMIVVQPLVREMLAKLDPRDRVRVVGSYAISLATPGDVARTLEARWRTQGTAFDLTRVLAGAKPAAEPLVLISDGLVADDAAAISAAVSLGVPVHVVAVGPAPARGLLSRIAASTGGTFRDALPADDLHAIAAAVVTDVITPPPPMAVTWGTLRVREVVPAILPRLGAGQALLVLARVDQVESANARAQGQVFALQPIPPGKAVDGAVTAIGPLGRRWGRARLDDLLVGRPDSAAVIRHARAYGLVSPYTSLVAIGQDVVVRGGVRHSVTVPVSVPSGMRWQDVERETRVKVDAEIDGLYESKVVSDAPAGNKDGRSDDDVDVKRRAKGTDQKIEPSPNRAPTVTTRAPSPASDDAEPDMLEGSRPPRQAHEDIGTRQVFLLSRTRWSVSAGAGVAHRDGDTRPLGGVGARVERGIRTMVGLDGRLWLDDELALEGRVLVTVARAGLLDWLTLGAGLGLHLGGDVDGVGAAVDLRVQLPPTPRGSIFGRWDGALEGQSTLTLGLELGF